MQYKKLPTIPSKYNFLFFVYIKMFVESIQHNMNYLLYSILVDFD